MNRSILKLSLFLFLAFFGCNKDGEDARYQVSGSLFNGPDLVPVANQPLFLEQISYTGYPDRLYIEENLLEFCTTDEHGKYLFGYQNRVSTPFLGKEGEELLIYALVGGEKRYLNSGIEVKQNETLDLSLSPFGYLNLRIENSELLDSSDQLVLQGVWYDDGSREDSLLFQSPIDANYDSLLVWFWGEQFPWTQHLRNHVVTASINGGETIEYRYLSLGFPHVASLTIDIEEILGI